MNARHEREREAPGEAELRHRIASALGQEPLLGQCSIHPDGPLELPRAIVLFPEGVAGSIDVAVDGRVARLRGSVATAGQKELAGATAARVPGCRTVVNELSVLC